MKYADGTELVLEPGHDADLTEVRDSREAIAACARGDHEWGAVARSHFAGTLHRPCTHCDWVSLDLDDDA